MRMNNEEENFEQLDNIEKRFDITNHMHLAEIINELNICLLSIEIIYIYTTLNTFIQKTRPILY